MIVTLTRESPTLSCNHCIVRFLDDWFDMKDTIDGIVINKIFKDLNEGKGVVLNFVGDFGLMVRAAEAKGLIVCEGSVVNPIKFRKCKIELTFGYKNLFTICDWTCFLKKWFKLSDSHSEHIIRKTEYGSKVVLDFEEFIWDDKLRGVEDVLSECGRVQISARVVSNPESCERVDMSIPQELKQLCCRAIMEGDYVTARKLLSILEF
jgi:hypothetical protein